MCIDGIKNAAAFGIPDTTRENRIVSVIETDGKHSRRSLTHSLKDRITYYTIPNKFYLCQEWPKTASGKTDVRKLKEQIMSSTLVEIS
jgi:long-chain acyl-CoA synthetase